MSSACLLLLFLLLPALVAGVRLDAAPRSGELLRVLAALDNGAPSESPVALLYYGLTIPDDPSGDLEQTLVLARRAQILGILALTALLYLSLRMLRGRSVAILACLALAALPPVASDGYVLRAETPAAVFGSLAVLLLQGLPAMIRSRHRSWPVRAIWQLVLMSAVGLALGLAVASLGTYRIYLLLPAALLGLSVSLLTLRSGRVLRRRGAARLPTRAFALRLLPWVGTAFSTLFFSMLLLSSGLAPPSEPQLSMPSDRGLLPGSLPLGLPLAALAGLGGFGLLMRTGFGISQSARPSAAAVLLAWVMIMLVGRSLQGAGTDGLPAAPALAVLIAEGVGVVWVIAAPRLRRRGAGKAGRVGSG